MLYVGDIKTLLIDSMNKVMKEEIAIAQAQELYPMDKQKRKEYIENKLWGQKR